MANILEVRDLCKTYIVDKMQNNVLKNVNFDIQEGEMVAIMGPSGSGKSTLLYAVSGMDKPTSGDVYFDGNDIAKYKADDNSIENVLVDISNSGYYALKNFMESFKIT